MPPDHTRQKWVINPFVISSLLTGSIVPVALVRLFEGVIMVFKQKLMACTALLGVWLLLPATAGAQSASDAAKIEKLERQTELLQKQSELLQRQLKEVQR
jgi:thiazole synthase ThiGH ThiG subunit